MGRSKRIESLIENVINMLYIIKIGGNIVDNVVHLEKCLELVSKIKGPKIIVHGGGKVATELAKTLKISQTIVEGRRITDTETLKIAVMVYAGLINKQIVAQLQSLDVHSIGLCGADANSILSIKRPIKTIDYGWVGDINSVNDTFVTQLLDQGMTPVFAPISHDGKGQLLNVNADTIAAHLAMALCKTTPVHLIYCFEKKGVLQDIDNEDSFIPRIDTQMSQDLIVNGQIHSGMLPKIRNIFDTLNQGVQAVSLGHALELQKIIQGQSGTKFEL